MPNAEQEILRKKLQKFKDDNNINDYDLGLEIGLSSDTILNFRKGRDILPRSLDKIAEFFKTYVTPEQKINNLQRENAELKAYKDVNEDFKTAWEELKAKNFELKESLKCFQTPEAIKALTFYKTGEFELQEKKCIELEQENARLKEENEKLNKMTGLFSVRLCEKYHKTLQEIKAIAEAPKPFIDFSETKTATEVEYDYAAICNELELRLHKVLELITKAEEE